MTIHADMFLHGDSLPLTAKLSHGSGDNYWITLENNEGNKFTIFVKPSQAADTAEELLDVVFQLRAIVPDEVELEAVDA